jgi:hypothetical protein
MALEFTVGFTGTSRGMSAGQKVRVREYLSAIKQEFPAAKITFHHGLCIGADEQAARIAKELGYYVVAHPGYSPRNPEGRLFRSDFDGNDEVCPEKPHIPRDHDIVDGSQRLVAAPWTREEIVRSGTWTTVRYARKKGKPILMALPEE